MNNAYGIILDGDIAVGKFVFITEEDKSGQREIMKLDIHPMYVDIRNGKINKHLRCLLVENIPEDLTKNLSTELQNPLSVKILADLGIGTVHGKVSLNENQAHYHRAVFSKVPKILNPKLN